MDRSQHQHPNLPHQLNAPKHNKMSVTWVTALVRRHSQLVSTVRARRIQEKTAMDLTGLTDLKDLKDHTVVLLAHNHHLFQYQPRTTSGFSSAILCLVLSRTLVLSNLT